MTDIETAFALLAPPNGSGSESLYSVTNLTGEQYLLGKDATGAPVILIKSPPEDKAIELLSVELENVTVSHRLNCRVTFPDGTEQLGRFSLIRCRGESELYGYFLWVMYGLVRALGPKTSAGGLAKAVTKLVDLFRSIRQPPRKSTQGLWGELMIIARSSNVLRAAAAWHATTQDIYDFNAGTQRVEVKSFVGRRRLHHFSMAQLQPPSGTEVMVASVPVEPAGAGVSTQELAQEISERLQPHAELAVHLATVITETLGSAWREAVRLRFDRQAAEEHLAFYHHSVVPTVRSADVPSEISRVNFVSDLSGCPATSEQHLCQAGDLFAALSGANKS